MLTLDSGLAALCLVAQGLSVENLQHVLHGRILVLDVTLTPKIPAWVCFVFCGNLSMGRNLPVEEILLLETFLYY